MGESEEKQRWSGSGGNICSGICHGEQAPAPHDENKKELDPGSCFRNPVESNPFG